MLTRALLLLCNIEEKGEEQREEIPLAFSVLQYCDFFFPLYVTIMSSRDENNLIFTKPGRWNDSYVHHRQTCRDSTCQGPFNGAWMCTVSVHIVQMCINMWGSWFAKKKKRETWIRFERAFDLIRRETGRRGKCHRETQELRRLK